MTITFTKQKLEKLKEQYNHSVNNKLESFIFEGQEILTDYAKYMIQYLESKLG